MTWRRIGFFLAGLATVLLAVATVLAWFLVLVATGLSSGETPGSEIAEADLLVSAPVIVALCAWGLWFRLGQAMPLWRIGQFVLMAISAIVLLALAALLTLMVIVAASGRSMTPQVLVADAIGLAAIVGPGILGMWFWVRSALRYP